MEPELEELVRDGNHERILNFIKEKVCICSSLCGSKFFVHRVCVSLFLLSNMAWNFCGGRVLAQEVWPQSCVFVYLINYLVWDVREQVVLAALDCGRHKTAEVTVCSDYDVIND
jgi:hypothetical protein